VEPERSLRSRYRVEADRYLAECFANATPPHINELARRVGLSPTSLSRAFRAREGVALSEYLKMARVARARELLTTTALPTAAIAYAAGFGTRVTFFRAFRRATGMTPDEYRSRNAQKM
jgi:transcriptional regulator GlxA family with amidase domain